jgi:hypothetical protein
VIDCRSKVNPYSSDRRWDCIWQACGRITRAGSSGRAVERSPWAALRRCGTYKRALALKLQATIAGLRPTVASRVYSEVRGGSRRPRRPPPGHPHRSHPREGGPRTRDVATGRVTGGNPPRGVDQKVADLCGKIFRKCIPDEGKHEPATFSLTTRDLLLNRELLYRLSYSPLFQGMARSPIGVISPAVKMCDLFVALLGRFLP